MKSIHGSSIEDPELLQQLVTQVMKINSTFMVGLWLKLFLYLGTEGQGHRNKIGDTQAKQEEFCPIFHSEVC